MGRPVLTYLPRTDKRWFVLMSLSEKPKTIRDTSLEAHDCSLAMGDCWPEWATSAFRELRGWGYIRYVNQRKNRQQVHEITPKGRALLEEWDKSYPA